MKHFSQNTLIDNKLKTYIMFVIFKTSNKDFILNKTKKKILFITVTLVKTNKKKLSITVTLVKTSDIGKKILSIIVTLVKTNSTRRKYGLLPL